MASEVLAPGAGPWLEDLEELPLPGPDRLPERVEVVVIGGGLTGVAVALFLAQGGAQTLLVESRPAVGQAASGRRLGLVVPAVPEHPYRLVYSLGEERARQLFAYTAENASLLATLTEVAPTGSLWVAMDDKEPAQLEQSAAALEQLGVAHAQWSDVQVADAIGGEGFGPALFLPDDGLVDPATAVQDIARQALTAGAMLHVDCPVSHVDRVDEDVEVVVAGRTVHTEVVVFAANAWLPGIDAYFHDKITPVREAALATEPVAPFLPMGVRAQYGHMAWRQTPDGRLLVRGARWATPHLEMGESEEVPSDKVLAKLEAFLHTRYPQLASARRTHRWAWIDAAACDGLPFVGPVPGNARFIACAGFSGNELGLGVRSARAVADGLLHGTAQGVPDFLAFSRMF